MYKEFPDVYNMIVLVVASINAGMSFCCAGIMNAKRLAILYDSHVLFKVYIQ